MNRIYKSEVIHALHSPSLPSWEHTRLRLWITSLHCLIGLGKHLLNPFRSPSWPWAAFCLVLSILASFAFLANPDSAEAGQRMFNLSIISLTVAIFLYGVTMRAKAFAHIPIDRIYTLTAWEFYAIAGIGLATAARPISPWFSLLLIISFASVMMLTNALAASCLVALMQRFRLIPV